MSKAGSTIEITLSTFVGIAAALSLQNFLDYEVLKWIGSSITVIFFSIFLIYLMLDASVPVYGRALLFKIVSIILVTFFPFSFQKAFGDYQNKLPSLGLPIHLLFIGVVLLVWVLKDGDLSKEKKWSGGTIGVLSIVAGIVWFLLAY